MKKITMIHQFITCYVIQSASLEKYMQLSSSFNKT